MTNRNRFFYNGILLTVVGLALRGAGLVFGAYISRAVGAEAVGLHSLIMTVYSFAVTLATSGISLTVTRLVAGAVAEVGEGGGGRVLRGAVLYSLLFGMLASLGLFTLAGSLGELVLGYSEGTIALRILSLSLIPTALSSVFSGYFVGVKRVACNALVQVFGQLFRIGYTVFLVARMASGDPHRAVTLLCLGTTVTELVCFLIVLVEFIIDRLCRRAREGGGALLRPVFGMALPLAVSAYIRSALLTLEHSLIPKGLKKRGEDREAALSSYGYLHGMALPLILYPMAPLSSFAGLLVPEFAAEGEGSAERHRRIASEAVNATLLYSSVAAVFLYIFSEELGYTVYGSYDAGHYIALLSPVVPIMYLDHVTDSILKGIGEHVYSMWVNIADSLISVALVFFLIPIMGIGGYAVVIVGMELFNFILSIVRLRGRIRFSADLFGSFLLPLVAAMLAALLSKCLFLSVGRQITALLLVGKIVFAVCAFIAIRYILVWIFSSFKIKQKEGSPS